LLRPREISRMCFKLASMARLKPTRITEASNHVLPT
jgi:hypothetical protein